MWECCKVDVLFHVVVAFISMHRSCHIHVVRLLCGCAG